MYPDSWTKGIIVPIFKKGDTNDPSNYRGITLVNVIGKIFSLTLRNRLNSWCENENVFHDAQFGFRDNCSTVDAVFLLHSIIQKILSQNSKLWCVFIDYQRAFDTVIRDSLWLKLIQAGVSCKMLRMIRSMYETVKSCVKVSNDMNMSDFFDISLGLKQGEPLSPILFILFINDVVKHVDLDKMTETDLNLLSRYLIAFADDIVLFTTNPTSLQSQIDEMYKYSVKWGMKINVNKTKICVFEKRKQRHNVDFFIGDEKIEIVDSFIYLGIKLTHTGNMSSAVKTLTEQALKAYHNLLSLLDKVSMDFKTKLKLFETMVVPILTYGAEVWGVYNYKEVDKLYVKFCKYILGVKQQTPNMAVFGELGRYPPSLICKEKSIKFWTKIMSNRNSPLYSMYTDQITSINGNCWASRINSIIDHLGFTNLLHSFEPNMKHFSKLQRRLRDQFLQDWNEKIHNMPKLELYVKYKTTFGYEDYLDSIANETLRKQISCIRLSSHNLEIEAGRYMGIDRNQRSCKLCNLNVVESEYHFIMCCPKFSEIRERYLGRLTWPSINKFVVVMSSTHKKKMNNLAKFIKEAYKIRTNALHV